MYRTAKDGLEKDVLKGTRWLLLKRPENLDASHNEHERLEEALRLNAPLATAYYLKEELVEFWEQDDQEEAEAFLLDWILQAESTDIRVLHQFARALRFHAHGLLAYYDYGISTPSVPIMGETTASWLITVEGKEVEGWREQGC